MNPILGACSLLAAVSSAAIGVSIGLSQGVLQVNPGPAVVWFVAIAFLLMVQGFNCFRLPSAERNNSTDKPPT